MTVILKVLSIQEHRIRRARALVRHADRAHEIALHHAQHNALINKPGHDVRAFRGYALARRLYSQAERILTGAA